MDKVLFTKENIDNLLFQLAKEYKKLNRKNIPAEIVIIGGHINWQNKLKQMFPEWIFVHPDAYKTVNAGMLEDKEKVYFFTDYINHISYKKFIAIARERNIPFGYIGSRNIDSVAAQIYQEMVR